MTELVKPPPNSLSAHATKPSFISLRWKLLLGFTLVFSSVFAAAYWWFYNFSTQRAIDRLKQDLQNTAIGAARGVNVPDLMVLYKQGSRNVEGFSDDPRYKKQLQWFETVHSVSPNVYPYTYIMGKPSQNRRIGEPATTDPHLETIYLVDSLWIYIPERALKFLEPDDPSDIAEQAYINGETVIRDLYTDEWGSWISAYTPIKDKDGNIVAGLGADIEATYVFEVQKAIRNRILISFGVTYGTLFSLVYLVSGILCRPLKQLAEAADQIGEGNYDQDFSRLSQARSQDEISGLARVLEGMVGKVRLREETLKQQVAELKIEIDHVKRQKQVSEIVDTDFFQDLVVKARKLRTKSTNRPDDEAESVDL